MWFARSTYQVLEALEDLSRVEGDRRLVVLQRAPLGPEQLRQAACKQEPEQC